MKLTWFLIAGATSLLVACGGGDDTPSPAAAPPVTSEVPATASMSVAGFLSYLKQLVVADADTLEPVDVSAVTPPTADDAEPDVVD